MKITNQTKVTRKGASIQSTIVGRNAFRRSESIVVSIKKECVCATYDGKFTLEITTTEKPGNDMDWNKKTGHWSDYQKKLIVEAGGTITTWGHVYFKRMYSTYGLAAAQFNRMMKLAVLLTKTPEHLK
jgi:hypothetical protein